MRNLMIGLVALGLVGCLFSGGEKTGVNRGIFGDYVHRLSIMDNYYRIVDSSRYEFFSIVTDESSPAANGYKNGERASHSNGKIEFINDSLYFTITEYPKPRSTGVLPCTTSCFWGVFVIRGDSLINAMKVAYIKKR